ncbi:MFS transporter [Shinella kummerowiae]|uniref:MFS transporter n=1 Tax=Shinella kummerowiae TaxID=417745 RepID=A0A6N8SJQ2_9HYPH|nr:MFS transporter [Shinella kummerowiae]MXN49284.1 MFS transporter [Shinella kummerowiae]
MRGKGLVWRLARPLLAVAFLAQVIVPLARIATSYRATEAGLSPAQVLVLSSAFALLPAFLAVGMGRYNDRQGAGGAALAGAVLLASGCAALLLPLATMAWLVLASVLLGLGQTLQLTALQAEIGSLRVQTHRERMVGGLMLWQAVGQIGAPLLLSLVALRGGNLPGNLAIVATTLAAFGAMTSILLYRNAAPPRSVETPASLRSIAGVPGLAWVIAGGSLCVAVQDLTLIYLPVVGETRSVPPVVVGALLMLFAVTQMLSRALHEPAAARFGPTLLLWGSVLGTGFSTAALALPVNVLLLAVALATSGFCLGFAITASVALTMRLAPPGARSTSLGLRLAINRAGQFAIPLVAGLIAAAQAGAVFLLLGLAVAGTGAAGFRRRR